jgi:uncharacterized SAM-binding protein YcdF (DUF218 family)
MKQVLERELGATVRWVEDRALDTWQNAENTRAILAVEKIDRIFLVCRAFEMQRARETFEAFGFVVIPAPVAFHLVRRIGAMNMLPHHEALKVTSIIGYELLGRLYYRLRFRARRARSE